MAIQYGTLVWTIYGTTSTLWILDRFFTNLWPRDTMSIGDGLAGSDFGKDGVYLKEGPWTVPLYDLVTRSTGRYAIVALNVLLITQMNSMFASIKYYFGRNTYVDLTSMPRVNADMHRWNGMALAIATLAHVWFIVFPSIFHGFSMSVVPGKFEWILSERTDPNIHLVNSANKTVMLKIEDVWRMVLMTILLMVLLPLSVRWLRTKYHIGIHLHSFIAVMYFVDIVRRHSHPHSWILNTPIFVAWLIDKLVGKYWRHSKPDFRIIHISNDYMCIYWTDVHPTDVQSRRTQSLVAHKCYFKLDDCGILEPAHPFSGFLNRTSADLPESSDRVYAEQPFSGAVVMRVYHEKRSPAVTTKDSLPFTHRLADLGREGNIVNGVNLWGPFHGDLSCSLFHDLNQGLPGKRSLVIVAGGSAVGVLIDVLQLLCSSEHNMPLYRVLLIFSCRDTKLVKWVDEFVNLILSCADPKSSRRKTAKSHATRNHAGIVFDVICTGEELGDDPINFTEEGCEINPQTLTRLNLLRGRHPYEGAIPCGSKVYVIGSGGLMHAVEVACDVNNCELVRGPTYDNGAPAAQSPTEKAMNEVEAAEQEERQDARRERTTYDNGAPAAQSPTEKAMNEVEAAEQEEQQDAQRERHLKQVMDAMNAMNQRSNSPVLGGKLALELDINDEVNDEEADVNPQASAIVSSYPPSPKLVNSTHVKVINHRREDHVSKKSPVLSLLESYVKGTQSPLIEVWDKEDKEDKVDTANRNRVRKDSVCEEKECV